MHQLTPERLSGAQSRWKQIARLPAARYATVIVVVLAAWQASGATLNPIFISTPSRIAVGFYRLLVDGRLIGPFCESLYELVLGLVIASVLGVTLGLAMGRIAVVERALDPLVAFGNATPTVAILPVMEALFGLGRTARVIFIASVAVWPLIINTLSGVRAVNKGLRDVGVAFGLRGWKLTWHLYLPGSMGYLFAGGRIALALGAIGMVLSGQEVGESGLGGLAESLGTYFQTGRLVAVVFVTTGLAAILFWALNRAQQWWCPWIKATATREAGQ